LQHSAEDRYYIFKCEDEYFKLILPYCEYKSLLEEIERLNVHSIKKVTPKQITKIIWELL
jgi:hypothetical protein